MRMGSETYFAVQSTPSASPVWVREGERVDEVLVSGFNAETDTLVVEVRGKVFELRLPEARVRSESEPVGAELTRTEALAMARREVERRDGWTKFSLVQARKPEGGFHFYALNRSGPKTERRLVVISPESRVTQYRKLAPLAHAGTLPIFAEPFTVAVKRPLFSSSR